MYWPRGDRIYHTLTWVGVVVQCEGEYKMISCQHRYACVEDDITMLAQRYMC